MKYKKRLFLLFSILFTPILALCLWWYWPGEQSQPSESTQYVDMHLHTAGLGYGGSGAFISQSMRDSYKFPVYLWAMDTTEEALRVHGDAIVIKKIAAKIARSQRVAKGVVLALDGVITDGDLDPSLTQLYVPNAFIAREVGKYDNLLYGASINPKRPDAIERLRRAKRQGAVLVKWLPNIMHFDPGDPAFSDFYREMVRLKLPLLSHAGQERAFAGAIDRYGDPRRLKLPLELGVTVIAAHIATTGESEGEGNYQRIQSMFAEYPNLYTDISSLTQANKRGYLRDALENGGFVDRLIYGTDWPLQFSLLVSPVYQLDHLTPQQAKAIARIANQWDRDVALKEAMGVPKVVFERSAAVLGL